MIKIRNPLLFTSLLLLSSHAYSGETVFLVDTSSSMKQSCTSASVKKSALTLAVNSIETTLASYNSAQQATIIGFSKKSVIHSKNTSANDKSIQTALKKLKTTNK